jgi:DUF4097 and DUF4098 domain-containing protein YvlB
MAAAPPPYTGPTGNPGGPGNYDPRQQWRQQRRLRKEQWRAQRAYYRQLRRPSLIRPVLLIAVGLLALLIQTGTLSGYTFWDWYVRWWPLVLIGVGLLLLAEWFLQRDQPYAGRFGFGGLLWLLIFLPLLGVLGRHAANSPFGWHFSPDDDWSMHLFGQEHDTDRQFDEAFGSNGRLSIDNPRGDVTIAVSADERIHVSAHQTVYSPDDKDAEKQLARLTPALRVNGSDATLSTPYLNRGSVDLTVQVPETTSLSIVAGRGNVAVNGLNGGAAVDASHGDVTLNKIGGPCTAKLSGGNFAAHALSNTLHLSGRTEDADISDVSGKVMLEGTYLGDVNLAKIAAPLSLHSSRTTLDLDRLDGELSLDHNDLSVNRAAGNIRITTKDKNITSTNVGGPLHIETSNGDIHVELASGQGAAQAGGQGAGQGSGQGGPRGPIELRNRNGGIHLGLPAGALFRVDASTHDGDVTSDLNYNGKVERSDKSLNGDTGTGTGPAIPVTLVTDHGDVMIQRSGAQSLPAPPEPPTPPPAPHAPRLRLPKDTPTPQTSEQ